MDHETCMFLSLEDCEDRLGCRRYLKPVVSSLANTEHIAGSLNMPQVHAMKNASPQVDAYIAKSAEFARPILQRIRALFHDACPEIEETLKWSFPHFEYRGIVGSMAAFKEHVSFGFWKGKLLRAPAGQLDVTGNTDMA